MNKTYVVPKDDSKKEKAKAWLKNRYIDVRCFWEENKQEIVTLVPVIISGTVVMVKVFAKRNSLNAEKRLKELFVWDPKLGRYWEIKRKLSAVQALELERRRNAGEGMGEILASMKVLKY